MDVIVYAQKSSDQKRLGQIIGATDKARISGFFSSVSELGERLRRPLLVGTVVVCVVRAHLELAELLDIRELLWELRLILMLPDQLHDFLKAGHMLEPRYITYDCNNFSDIGQVVGKMA